MFPSCSNRPPFAVAAIIAVIGSVTTPVPAEAQVSLGGFVGAWYSGAQQRHPFVYGTFGLTGEYEFSPRFGGQVEVSTTTFRPFGETTDIWQLGFNGIVYFPTGGAVWPFAQAGGGWRQYRNWVSTAFPEPDRRDFRYGRGAFFNLGGGVRLLTSTALATRLTVRWLHSGFETNVPLLDDAQNDFSATVALEVRL